MGDLSLALNNALSGLNINRQALSVLSQNIANANTKGYSRKIINQSAVYLDGDGAGTSIASINRKVDDYLLRAVRSQNAVIGQAGTASDYFDRTQILIGKPGSSNSIDAYIRQLFSSLQSLTTTPESATLRVGVVSGGLTLAAQANQLARGLQDLRFQADGDISAAVTAINQSIIDLGNVNAAIVDGTQRGRPVSELLDKRDLLLNDISQYLDIQTNPRSNGGIDVYTSTGVSLLDDSVYQLSYTRAGAVDVFTNGTTLGALEVRRLNATGTPVGVPVALISSGVPGSLSNILGSGKLKSLLDMRDVQIPAMLSQLDTLTAQLRDSFNAAHNAGIAFPGANSYTGQRPVSSSDYTSFSGSTRFALLDSSGRPVASPYADEPAGRKPLLLDFSKLNTGAGAGYPSVQGIIDEFNNYYASPGNKAVVGNLNNIRLATNNSSIPGSPAQLNFDFDLDNISATGSNFYVTNVSVADDNGDPVTPVTNTAPVISLDSTNTYVTSNGSTTVTINTDSSTPNGLEDGDVIFLSTPPGGTINGIPTSELGGYVTVRNVTDTSFDIVVTTPADNSPAASVASQTAQPPYARVEAGGAGRTTADGTFTAALNTTSSYFTVTATVGVDDGSGNIVQSQVSYRVNNNQANTLNQRFAAANVTGQGTLVTPSATAPTARAILVDANGNELPKVNGKYSGLLTGYLKFVSDDPNNNLAIDSMDSSENGRPNDVPPTAATGRSFSYFFELNNFFNSNGLPGTDTVTNSAMNLAVTNRLRGNPNLLSLGGLTLSTPTGDTPVYTYERSSGDNSIVQRLAQLGIDALDFPASGGLGQSRQNFASYAAQIIGTAATKTASAQSEKENQQVLYDGFAARSSSISGVNLDEELANTVIYQNAYGASARIISVTNELFDTLLQVF